MSDDKFDAALDLLRRLNPQNISSNLSKIIALEPSLAEELLSSVDTPLTIVRDPETGKSFLACDYNRDLDSYRSPWSNKYVPALEDDESPYPSDELRELEVKMNDAFDVYRDLYYEGGVSSVYLWDTEDEKGGFAGVVLMKKGKDDGAKGQWDSIHVIEVEQVSHGKAVYKVTTTIILDLSTAHKELGLSGNLIRQTEKECEVETGDQYAHIVNLGTLIEDVESKLRNLLQQVYFDKTRDIIGDVRSLSSLSDVANDKKLHSEVVKGIQGL